MPELGTWIVHFFQMRKSFPNPNLIPAVRLLPTMEIVSQRKVTLSEILIMIDSDTPAFSKLSGHLFPLREGTEYFRRIRRERFPGQDLLYSAAQDYNTGYSAPRAPLPSQKGST